MYITVMDFSTSNITTIACDLEFDDNKDIESLLECCGYHLSQISYMTSEEDPEIGFVELTDVLSERTIQEFRK